jgi:hypothetical protein
MQETYRAKRHFTSNNAVGGNHFIPPTALRFPTYRAKAFHLPHYAFPPTAPKPSTYRITHFHLLRQSLPPTALRFPTYRAKAFHLPRLWLPPPAFALSRFVLPAGYDGFADNVRGNARWLLRLRG